jgi:hypothetical protein
LSYLSTLLEYHATVNVSKLWYAAALDSAAREYLTVHIAYHKPYELLQFHDKSAFFGPLHLRLVNPNPARWDNISANYLTCLHVIPTLVALQVDNVRASELVRSPLQHLRALKCENLRRVSKLGALATTLTTLDLTFMGHYHRLRKLPNLPALTTLRLVVRTVESLDEVGAVALAATCPQLHTLHLDKVRDQAAFDLAFELANYDWLRGVPEPQLVRACRLQYAPCIDAACVRNSGGFPEALTQP